MQILQWLSKISQEPPKELVLNHSSLTKRDEKATKNNTTEILVFVESGRVKRKNNRTVELTKLNCENLNLFGFLQRKDVSKAYFYHTLNLTKLRSFRKSEHSLDSKKFPKREDSASAHGGSKVLPITDSSSHSPSSSRRSSVDQRSVKDDKKEKPKTKNVSKMKELVRWASGLNPEKRGKFGKNGLHVKIKPASMNVPNDDDQLRRISTESPKISFTWELSETSAVSSSYFEIPDISTSTAILSSKNEELIDVGASVSSAHLHVSDGAQCGGKLGNWITTDSEFVVLEL